MFMPRLEPGALGWQVHRDFAQAVVDRDQAFSILSTSPADGERDMRPTAEETAHDFTVLPEPRGVGFWSDLAAPLLRNRTMIPAALALMRHLRRHGDEIDLLHVEIAYPHGTTAALAIALSGWEGLLAIRPVGEDVLVVEDAAYGFRLHPVPDRLVRWALRRCDAIRCISPMIENFVESLAPRGILGTIPVNVTRRFVQLSEETEAERATRRTSARAHLLEELDLAAESTIVVALGRLHPFKGIDLLLQAVAPLPRIRLVIAGPSLSVRPFGDMKTRLERQARELGIADRVRFPGRIPPRRVPALLSGADVVAVPSYRESFNKVSIEAVACGTPVIVTSTTGISSYMKDGELGFIVPPRSVEQLTWALSELQDGRWTLDTDAARCFVHRFAPERIADEVIALYRRAAAAR